MKNLATILCVGIIGFTQAQTTSKDVEIYERYENGELVEQRQSATENGVPIENYDFEKAKREMQLKSAGMQESMEQKMEEMKRKMDVRMQEMDQRMQDFGLRVPQPSVLFLEKDRKMKENKKPELKNTPAPSERPAVGTSTEDVKFT